MRGSLFGVNDGRPFTGSCADIQLPGGHLKGVRGLSLVQTAVLKGDRSHVIHYCCAFECLCGWTLQSCICVRTRLDSCFATSIVAPLTCCALVRPDAAAWLKGSAGGRTSRCCLQAAPCALLARLPVSQRRPLYSLVQGRSRAGLTA